MSESTQCQWRYCHELFETILVTEWIKITLYLYIFSKHLWDENEDWYIYGKDVRFPLHNLLNATKVLKHATWWWIKMYVIVFSPVAPRNCHFVETAVTGCWGEEKWGRPPGDRGKEPSLNPLLWILLIFSLYNRLGYNHFKTLWGNYGGVHK